MIIPYAKPGTAVKNKTGNWRTFKPALKKGDCIKCGICQFYCPENCIDGTEKNPKQLPDFDMDFCKGCGVCANVCPKKAIDMVRE
jgi:2-oxoacid:acceptor oxidoreductase delta subunit (pyruvate/2-ketoisovalerate family)